MLFYCSGVSITLESWLKDPTVDILGADNISFQSRDWIFYVIVSVWLCTATKTEDDPLSIQYDV